VRAVADPAREPAPLPEWDPGKIEPEGVCRQARNLLESLRPALSPQTALEREHAACIYLQLLALELNPDGLPRERQGGYRGPIIVRRALEDLRDVCEALMHPGPRPAGRAVILRKLKGALLRLESAAGPAGCRPGSGPGVSATDAGAAGDGAGAGGRQDGRGGPVLRLELRDGAVYLDGEPVPLDLTAEARAEALRYLAALLSAPRTWVTGPDIEKGIRWDRVRKRLPPVLLGLIETDRRKGNRLAAAAWRR
jgi:hypothetical protein